MRKDPEEWRECGWTIASKGKVEQDGVVGLHFASSGSSCIEICIYPNYEWGIIEVSCRGMQ